METSIERRIFFTIIGSIVLMFGGLFSLLAAGSGGCDGEIFCSFVFLLILSGCYLPGIMLIILGFYKNRFLPIFFSIFLAILFFALYKILF